MTALSILKDVVALCASVVLAGVVTLAAVALLG